ncbi:MAG: class I SAM-dependent methyltransferase [Candidatus Omnitrophica bacterium]|nr:class I SAM-dependent methyltransferase [Candidatus Omnitrophota bacterium]
MTNVKFSSFDYSTVQGVPEIALRVELLSQRLQLLSKNEQPMILEIGVGTGDVTLMLAKQFKHVTCVDMEEDNCQAVSDRLKPSGLNHVEFVCSTIEAASLPKKSYQHIIMQNILEHLKDPVEVLKVVKNYLKPDGRIHLSVPLANSLHRWLGVELGMIPSTETLAESDIQYGHYRVYVPQLLRDHIQSAGYTVAFEKLFYLKPLTTAVLTPLSREIHEALFRLGERFHEFASYIYLEAMGR